MDESILRDLAKEGIINNANGEDFGWKQVSCKRNRKKHLKQCTNRASDSETLLTNANGSTGIGTDVFRSIELHDEEVPKSAVVVEFGGGSKWHSDEDNSDAEDSATATENSGGEVKTVKPKVTVAEAAAKISVDDLILFLIETMGSYESQQDIRLMRFADFFGRAFASNGAIAVAKDIKGVHRYKNG